MTAPDPQNDQKQLWGHHCLSEWCCPNRIENKFCICARNLDDMIESCGHDTRIELKKEREKVLDEFIDLLVPHRFELFGEHVVKMTAIRLVREEMRGEP